MRDDEMWVMRDEMLRCLGTGGRSFHSLAVLGTKEDLWALIREYGIENLFLRVGLM